MVLLSRANRQLQILLVALISLPVLLAPRPVLAHEAIYVVQEGETLSEIAQRFGTTAAELRSLNDLEDADVIYYGLPLLVPDQASEEITVGESPIGAEIVEAQQGQSLTDIALLRDAPVAELFALNQIDPAETLTDGQPVLVPVRSLDPVLPRPSLTIGPQLHTVKRGEHLGILAGRYGVTAFAIVRANDLGNADIIVPGQQLKIPSGDNNVAELAQSTGSEEALPVRTGKWIDVDLSEQRVTAYEDMTPVRTFVVSTGLPGTPTVTGEFRMWAKTAIQDMSGGSRAAGDYYYLEDVQWVQYFFEDYGFHGTYWHDNFGQPMSRGCVNMRNEDAKWLFDWATPAQPNTGGEWMFRSAEEPGTPVVVRA